MTNPSPLAEKLVEFAGRNVMSEKRLIQDSRQILRIFLVGKWDIALFYWESGWNGIAAEIWEIFGVKSVNTEES